MARAERHPCQVLSGSHLLLWPLQVGLLLLDSQLFIHLTHPADKLQLALQMLMKLYALVRHLPTATPLGR